MVFLFAPGGQGRGLLQQATVGQRDDKRVNGVMAVVEPVLCWGSRFLQVVPGQDAVQPQRPA